MEEALYLASITTLQMMETILEVMRLLEILSVKGSALAVSDAGAGVCVGKGALEGAAMNIFINTGMMKNRNTAEELQEKAKEKLSEGEALYERVYHSVLEKIK